MPVDITQIIVALIQALAKIVAVMLARKDSVTRTKRSEKTVHRKRK